MSDSGEPTLIANRYLLLGRLGRGGMGTVWRATDQLLERTVAVKEVHLHTGGEDLNRRAQRARREALALARITHPQVVDIYDLVWHEDRLWMVMELVNGPSLAEQLAAHGPMPPPVIAGIGLQLLSALDAVHAVGTLHRDVKPANILLRATGDVVLCDFGIAVLADTERLTSPGEVIGSLDFLAPERLSEQPVGPPSDLFSLGSTLYALLTGYSPFARSETAAILHAVTLEQPEIPAGAGPLGPILEAMLHKDPAARPSSAAVAGMLRPVAQTQPEDAHPPVSAPAPSLAPPTVPVTRTRRRPLTRRVLLPGVLLLVGCLAGGGILLSRGQNAAEDGKGAGAANPKSSPEAEKSAPDDRPASLDAVMPTPDDENQQWVFSGGRYMRIGATAEEPFRHRMQGPYPLTRWSDTFAVLPGFAGRIDATMRVPGTENDYWVFSGDQYIKIRVTDGRYQDELLKGPAPIDDWEGVLKALPEFADGIDAVMPTPDDPHQLWVFDGDQYIRTELDPGGEPSGRLRSGPRPLRDWTATFGKHSAFRKSIDAAMRVPGAENDYWVFSGDRYIKIRVTDDTYADTLLKGPRRLPDWMDLN